jgi:hypothetical protein
MKKFFITATIAASALLFCPTNSQAVSDSTIVSTTIPVSPTIADPNTLIFRLNEIKDMDKSDLTFSQKKELRQEVRGIEKQLREIGNGVYISAGGLLLVLVILLLIF